MKELPDTDLGQPYNDKSTLLENLFVKQCENIETSLLERFKKDASANLYAYDSGIGLEEILIDELNKIFPRRYTITNGILSDHKGYTSGHCDLVFFNEFWFPYTMGGVVAGSRKKYIPINGVYAVGEVKSTLNIATLDNACMKLVTCNRLSRLEADSSRITENRKLGSTPNGVANPLYTFIFAAAVDKGIDFQDLIFRFVEINRKLKRSEMIRGLCVPNYGTVYWVYKEDLVARPALFMSDDLEENLLPAFIPSQEKSPALYSFICNLHLHLYQSILPAEDFSLFYGSDKYSMKLPSEGFLPLIPDN